MKFWKRLLELALVSCAIVLSLGVAQSAPLKLSPKELTVTTTGYEIKLAYPRTGQATIDRQLESWVKGLAQEFSETAREANGPLPWSAELSYEVPRNDGGLLSLVFSYYNYTGGAHPNSNYHTFHFLVADGYDAEIAEIFTPRGIARISDMSIAQLKRDLGGPDGMSDSDWIKRGAGPNARNFRNFAILPQDLVIYFDAYQVAAYAAGPQEVRIPLSKLGDTIRPDVRAPAASFDCRMARTATEQAVCSSRDLAKLDRRLAESFKDKLVWVEGEKNRKALRDQQRQWIRNRDNSCQAARMNLVACLMPIYQKRVKELTAA